MYTVTKRFEISYAHRLFKYPGRCGNVHGHTAKVEITCSGDNIPDTGMLVDFRELKKKIGSWLDQNFDHRLILQDNDPLVQLLKDQNEDVVVLKNPPSAENLAKIIFEDVKKKGFPIQKVSFWESPTSIATYE